MINAVASQLMATTANESAALFDSSIRSHPNFPSAYPFSAYAYKLGTAGNMLAAEHQAEANENADPTVRAFFASSGVRPISPTMIMGLSIPRVTDRRTPGVVS